MEKLNHQLGFSVSATTRQPRPGEADGREYHFLSEADFRQKIEENAFLEYEEVYAGILYGTLWSEVEKIWAENKMVVFDDAQTGYNRLDRAPNFNLSIP